MRSLQIGNKTYKIEYDINSACDIEDVTGVSIIRLASISAKSARAYLWGGLRIHYPDLTLTDAGKLLSEHGDWPEVLNMCFEEMKVAGFFGKAGEKNPPKKDK
jgi:hypothetical protein